MSSNTHYEFFPQIYFVRAWKTEFTRVSVFRVANKELFAVFRGGDMEYFRDFEDAKAEAQHVGLCWLNEPDPD